MTTVPIPPLERGATAFGTALRCAAEAAGAYAIGLADEHVRQLDAARDLLHEAGRVAEIHDDSELLAAVCRAVAIVNALAAVPT